MKLSDLAKDTRKLTFDYDNGVNVYPIEFEYRVSASTLAMINEIEKFDTIERVVQQICKLLVSWNIQDGDEMLPLEPERLEQSDIPLDLLVDILGEIRKDQSLSSAEKKA